MGKMPYLAILGNNIQNWLSRTENGVFYSFIQILNGLWYFIYKKLTIDS